MMPAALCQDILRTLEREAEPPREDDATQDTRPSDPDVLRKARAA